MPPTHGRPRDKGGTDHRNLTAKEFESSNSTTSVFLGGAQKSWMIGLPPVTSQTPHTLTGRANPNARRSVSAANQASETLAGIHQAAASHQAVNRRPSAAISPSQVTPKTVSPSGARSKNPQSIVDTVLPSPAPSDEPRQGSVLIIDAEDETDKEEGEAQHQSEDRQENIVEEHSGVEEFENRIRDSESHNNSPMSFSADITPESVQNVPSNSARKRIQENESSARKRFQSVQGSPSERMPQSPLAHDMTAVDSASPAPSERSPSVSVATTFLAQLTQRAETIRQRHGQPIELSRLGLLRDAAECQDYFYFIMHQLFCMNSPKVAINPSSVFGFTPEHQAGLVLLERLLLPNSQLTDDAVYWFSIFPLPIEALFLQWPGLRKTYDRVLSCLAKLPRHWFQMRDHCQRRNYPPIIDEMIDLLAVDSMVLQRVMCRAIMRDIWKGAHDACYNEAEKLFSKNQQEFQSRLSVVGTPAAWTSARIAAHNHTLAISYQQLRVQHQQHPPPQLTRPNQQHHHHFQQVGGRTPAINTMMAPPQQVHIGVTSARNINTARALSQPASNPSSPSPVSPVATFTQAPLQGLANNLDRQRVVPSSPSATALPTIQSIRTSSTAWHPSASHFQSGRAVLQSNGRVLRPNQPSSMILSPTAVESPSATRNYPHGTHQREHPSRYTFSTPSPSVDSFSARPNTDGLQAVASRYAAAHLQSGIQNTPQHPNATFQMPRQGGTSSFGGNLSLYGIAGPNSPQVGMNQASPHYTTGSPNQAAVSQFILPPQGHVPLTVEPSNTVSSALHQAQARSPNCISVDSSGKPTSIKDCFGYVRYLDVIPNRLNAKRRHIKWTIVLPQEMIDLLVHETEVSNGAPPMRKIRAGARLCRIRCIKTNEGDTLKESEWVVADNVWPSGVAILVNGKALEIRKKFHHGKDLPIDVTKHLRQGQNVISVAMTCQRSNENMSYELGLETIQITDSSRIKEEMAMLDETDALQRILKHSRPKDPEVQVVDPTILLDLTDPYTSRIFNLPVRGKLCRHNQCFDLDVFLQTRGRKTPNSLPSPEYFKCPVCGMDARPQSLVMDLFFRKLRTELEQSHRLDVKAVLLGEQGDWTIREEEDVGEPGDGSGKRGSSGAGAAANASARAGRLSIPANSEIIEIDDD